MKQEEMTLEESFRELDLLIEAMEDREISLEDSFLKYKQGMELLKICNQKIDKVEKQMLILNDQGEADEF